MRKAKVWLYEYEKEKVAGCYVSFHLGEDALLAIEHTTAPDADSTRVLFHAPRDMTIERFISRFDYIGYPPACSSAYYYGRLDQLQGLHLLIGDAPETLIIWPWRHNFPPVNYKTYMDISYRGEHVDIIADHKEPLHVVTEAYFLCMILAIPDKVPINIITPTKTKFNAIKRILMESNLIEDNEIRHYRDDI